MLSRRGMLAGAAGALLIPNRALGASGYETASLYSAMRQGVSLLVMRAGKVLFADYPNGGSVRTAWELASGTKSFCGLMAAAASQDGLLELDEKCADTLTEWRGDARAEIGLRHLLSLTSGLQSGQIGHPPTYAEAVRALLLKQPGTDFAYGPVAFQVFGEIMRRKLLAVRSQFDPLGYLEARVLKPAGARIGSWQRGGDGQPLMPQGCALTAENWARFGQYVLDGAKGTDQAVLRACFEGSAANPGYGLSWWLLRPGLVGPGPRAGLSGADGASMADEDVVMAAGAGNQRLYLLRKRGLVVVRQAKGILAALQRPAGTRTWSDAEFLRLLLRATP